MVSNYLESREDDWVRVLGSLVPSFEKLATKKEATLVRNSLRRVRIDAGNSLDQFDLFCSWYQNHKKETN